MAAPSYYEILGVNRTASADEIQRAYRKLAREWHPDVNTEPGAEDRFKAISEANEVLSDPELRKKYDAFGDDFRKVPDGTDPSMWNRAGRAAGDFGFGGGGAPNLEDLLGGLFGGARRNTGPRAGQDQTVEIELSIEESYHGGERSLTLSGPRSSRSVTVNIPVGIVEGQRIRVRGEGGAGAGGGPAGDLFLTVRFADHGRYTVDGRNLSVKVPVTPWEAALGAKVSVETPGGPATIKVPAGTSSGRRLRLKGRGLPNPNGAAGDVYAVVNIVVPKDLTEREAELFAQLAEESSFDPRA